MEQGLHGDLVNSHTPQTTFTRGRQCAHPGCRTVLSMYNPEPLCSLHKASIVLLDRAEKVPKKRDPTKVSSGKIQKNRGVAGAKKGQKAEPPKGKKSSKRKG